MNISMPAFATTCIALLEEHGHSAYIVGGCVRDSLLGRAPKDWDICTSAPPDQMQRVFAGKVRTLPTGIKHGTITLLGDDLSIEATTFRHDGQYLDHRRPDTVAFTSELEDDLARRDFTVNAMAYHPQRGLCDPFDGQKDLAAGVLRCVGDPMRRFEEDALRILRLFRFGAQLGFEPQAQTLAGAKARRALLAFVSAERVSAELSKLIMGEDAHKALRAATASGVLEEILPEFGPSIGFDQRSPYHDRTVDEHSFAALAASPARHPIRLALLLHDIGKPHVATLDENGRGHYKGHAGVGAKIAGQILQRLHYPTKTAAYVEKLIAFHNKFLPAQPDVLRRLLGEHGPPFICDLLDVKEADNRAKSAHCAERLERYKQVRAMVGEILAAGHCLTLSDLAVNGEDLAGAGIPQGPETGQILRDLLKLVWKEPEKNTRAQLLEEVASKLAKDLGSTPPNPT